jgi:hypothetical protein
LNLSKLKYKEKGKANLMLVDKPLACAILPEA